VLRACRRLTAEVGVAANSTYTVFETDCSVLWQYTGTTDPTGSLGNLSVAPRFRSAATRDFTLLPASPSINAGDPDVIYNDVDGSRNNQGAYGGPSGTW
jgi:hypothetical protein